MGWHASGRLSWQEEMGAGVQLWWLHCCVRLATAVLVCCVLGWLLRVGQCEQHRQKVVDTSQHPPALPTTTHPIPLAHRYRDSTKGFSWYDWLGYFVPCFIWLRSYNWRSWLLVRPGALACLPACLAELLGARAAWQLAVPCLHARHIAARPSRVHLQLPKPRLQLHPRLCRATLQQGSAWVLWSSRR